MEHSKKLSYIWSKLLKKLDLHELPKPQSYI